MNQSTPRTHTAPITLHRAPQHLFPRAVSGRFNSLRWLMLWLTQIVFYGGVWLTWNGQPALLLDIVHERLHLFGLVLWPQDALLLALVLILAATALFLVTAVAGRVFCGFACPQTVYTSLFRWVESAVEGNHLARHKLAQRPLDADKLLRRGTKHALWLAIALWTGITFVGYFTPIRELLPRLADLALGPWEGFWVGFYGLFTYVQAGFTRELVCQHMCPYSRFQGVMFDPETRNVAYDITRGEPRGARSQGTQAGQARQGDCVDCGICVQVCPTGIDIRQGLQYQCINCGLCIDACDTVMDKIGSPRGLIRFASEQELASGHRTSRHWKRPRLAVYGAVLGVFTLMGAWILAVRSPLLVDVLRDRGSLVRETVDGELENAYTLKLMNRSAQPHTFEVTALGLPGLHLQGPTRFETAPGSTTPVHVTVALPPPVTAKGIQPMQFLIRAVDDASVQRQEKSTFVLP